MKKRHLLIIFAALFVFGQVAWGQTSYYVTTESELSSAISSCPDRSNIWIQDDFNITGGPISVPAKEININLNGHILSRNGSEAENGYLFNVAKNGKFTINGGTISGGNNSTDGTTVGAGAIVNNGTLILTNVTITNCKGKDGGAIKNNTGPRSNSTAPPSPIAKAQSMAAVLSSTTAQ